MLRDNTPAGSGKRGHNRVVESPDRRHLLVLGMSYEMWIALLIDELARAIRGGGKAIYFLSTPELLKREYEKYEAEFGSGKILIVDDVPIDFHQLMTYPLLFVAYHPMMELLSSEEFPRIMDKVRLIVLDYWTSILDPFRKNIDYVLIPMLTLITEDFPNTKMILTCGMSNEACRILIDTIPNLEVKDFAPSRNIITAGYVAKSSDWLGKTTVFQRKILQVSGNPKPVVFPDEVAFSHHEFARVVLDLADLVSQQLGKFIRVLVYVPDESMADKLADQLRKAFGCRRVVRAYQHAIVPEVDFTEGVRENEFIVSSFVVQKAVVIRDLHLLIIHPLAFMYRDVEGLVAGNVFKDDDFGFWLSSYEFMCMRANLGQKGLNDPGYVVVFMDEAVLDVWEPTLRYDVSHGFPPWPPSPYIYHIAVVSLAAYYGMLSDDLLGRFISLTPGYRLLLDKDDLTSKFYQAVKETSDLLTAYGLAKKRGGQLLLTRAGRALVRSNMPVREVMLMRDVLNLSPGELIKEIVTVKNDLGARLELFGGDIETLLAIGLVGPYLTSRMNPIAEAIRLSLRRMKVTALRLKALSPEEYKSLFDEETLDQIYKRLTQYEKDLMTRKLVWHWKT